MSGTIYNMGEAYGNVASDAVNVSFNNTGTSIPDNNVDGALKTLDGNLGSSQFKIEDGQIFWREVGETEWNFFKLPITIPLLHLYINGADISSWNGGALSVKIDTTGYTKMCIGSIRKDNYYTTGAIKEYDIDGIVVNTTNITTTTDFTLTFQENTTLIEIYAGKPTVVTANHDQFILTNLVISN